MKNNISVLKFGGKSLEDLQKVKSICEYISCRTQKEKIIMVVSAMGNCTNELIKKAEEFGELKKNSRELDIIVSTGEIQSAALCAIVLQSFGVKAISLNSLQANIYGKGAYGNAIITGIKKSTLVDYLQTYDVLVITGFQVASGDEILTIGRGGSDTTAVALGLIMNTEVEIFSDFAGIFAGDPRRLKYKKFENIGYDDAINIAEGGAKVLCETATMMAKQSNTKIVCKQSAEPETAGSYVFGIPRNNISLNIVENIAKITINFSNNVENMQKTLEYIKNCVKFLDIYINCNKIVLLIDERDIKKIEKNLAEINNLLE